MKIGIIGLGLIGGTIAKALKPYHRISAYDISKDTIEYAKNHDIIDQSYDDLKDFFRDNEVFYLCLYPNGIINFIFKNKDIIPNSRLIIEMSGIKSYLVNQIEKLRPLPFDLIYSHPIAGSEKRGVQHSNAKIFEKGNYVITPVKGNLEKNINITKFLAKEMGFKYISVIKPEEHDDAIAYTSQLTHVLSLSLVNAISGDHDLKKFIGDSYRDLTRISMINEVLWTELFIGNKEALLCKITDFESELTKVKNAIKMNDLDKLSNLMRKSTKIRLSIENGQKDES